MPRGRGSSDSPKPSSSNRSAQAATDVSLHFLPAKCHACREDKGYRALNRPATRGWGEETMKHTILRAVGGQPRSLSTQLARFVLAYVGLSGSCQPTPHLTVCSSCEISALDWMCQNLICIETYRTNRLIKWRTMNALSWENYRWTCLSTWLIRWQHLPDW